LYCQENQNLDVRMLTMDGGGRVDGGLGSYCIEGEDRFSDLSPLIGALPSGRSTYSLIKTIMSSSSSF
jgi:hypothetical protein